MCEQPCDQLELPVSESSLQGRGVIMRKLIMLHPAPASPSGWLCSNSLLSSTSSSPNANETLRPAATRCCRRWHCSCPMQRLEARKRCLVLGTGLPRNPAS